MGPPPPGPEVGEGSWRPSGQETGPRVTLGGQVMPAGRSVILYEAPFQRAQLQVTWLGVGVETIGVGLAEGQSKGHRTADSHRWVRQVLSALHPGLGERGGGTRFAKTQAVAF